MGLRDTYSQAIQTAKGKFQGNAEERDGKLYFKGSVASEDEKNQIWNAIKTVPTWQKDIVADIQVIPPAKPAAAAPKPQAAATGGRTYTVKAGDTLSQIAKDQLGSAGSYMKIFDLNKDVLSDPDKIKPGQVLRLP